MMSPLTISAIARKNIQRNPARSFCLVIVILLFTMLLFTGSVISVSLSNGAQSTANRLGADVMLVPAGFDPHVDSILLAGKPSTFYLPEDTMTLVRNLAADVGISAASPQTFLATLNASCCSYPVQIVGLDYDTDFIVKPWLESSLYHPLRDNEAVVGYHISGITGDKIKFFGHELTVAGRLEQTGMGFDAMIFMNRNTIALLAQEAERITGRHFRNDGSLDSVIMLKLKPGYDSTAAAIELNRHLNSQGIYALFSKKFVNSLGGSLVVISWVIIAGLAGVWLVSVIISGIIFAVTFSERKRELGVLRALGAGRSKIMMICLSEAFTVSSYGALTGIFLGGLLVLVSSPFVSATMRLPFLMPPISVLIMAALASAGISVITGTLSAVLPAVRASRVDVMDALRSA